MWPGGFSVRFEPSAAIYNEKGTVVARAGQRVELTQTRPEAAAGTFADPYVAAGLVFGDCYPYLP